MIKIYQIENKDKFDIITKNEMSKFEIIDYVKDESDVHIQGEPIIKGYDGPMYNGTRGGVAVIKYVKRN